MTKIIVAIHIPAQLGVGIDVRVPLDDPHMPLNIEVTRIVQEAFEQESLKSLL